MNTSAWQVFHVDDLKSKLKGGAVEYKEFLRVPSVSCGLYHLAAGSQDMQTPHDEDEMYFVVDGRARLKVGDEIYEVRPGSVLYVQATEEHSFFEIEEDMTLLVFFASTS
ncbi:MAG TPA: cupin domain-containing protein [Pseudomonadales bacterium]